MAQCPKCGDTIEELLRRDEVLEYQRFSLSIDPAVSDRKAKEGGYQFLEDDYAPRNEPVYLCPECGEPIAFDEDDAIAFLKGEPRAIDS